MKCILVNVFTFMTKYAYHIKYLYRLKEPLKLERLRDVYNFTAPQSYFYLENNEKLAEVILKQNLEKLF